MARKRNTKKILAANHATASLVNFKSFLTFIVGASTVLGAIYGALAFHKAVDADDELNSKFHGIWYSEYSYPSLGGMQEIKGTTQYLKNGSYTFIGEISAIVNSYGAKIKYQVDATGEWTYKSNSLIIKQKDIKTDVLQAQDLKTNLPLKVEGISLDKQLFRLDSRVPRDLAEQFDIISTNKDLIVMRGLDPIGNELIVKLMRQSKRFQRGN